MHSNLLVPMKSMFSQIACGYFLYIQYTQNKNNEGRQFVLVF